MKNEINYFKVVIISLIFGLFSLSVNAQHSYIQNHKKIALELSEQYGIPPAVILSIAFVESGGGTSKNSKTLNNHFGIVGKNNVSSSRYRYFNSVRESYEAFCKLVVRKKYYNKLKGTDNFSSWIAAIASAGYSTQPQEWMRRMNLIFNKFNLASLN